MSAARVDKGEQTRRVECGDDQMLCLRRRGPELRQGGGKDQRCQKGVLKSEAAPDQKRSDRAAGGNEGVCPGEPYPAEESEFQPDAEQENGKDGEGFLDSVPVETLPRHCGFGAPVAERRDKEQEDSDGLSIVTEASEEKADDGGNAYTSEEEEYKTQEKV